MNHLLAQTMVGLHNLANWAKRIEAEHPEKVYSIGALAVGAGLTAGVEFLFPGTINAVGNLIGEHTQHAAGFVLEQAGVLPVEPDLSPIINGPVVG